MHCDSKSGVQATYTKTAVLLHNPKHREQEQKSLHPSAHKMKDQTNSDLAVHHEGSLLRQQPRATYCKQTCTCKTKSDQTRPG